MTAATYPSEQHPAPAPVTIEIPEGWETLPVPGVALAIRASTPKDFTPNVIVRVGTRPVNDQPADILMELAGAMQGRPDAQISTPDTVEVNGREWTRIHVQWTDAENMPIRQEHLYVGLPRDAAVQDFFHLTSSVGGSGVESDRAVVDGVVNSLRIDA